MKRYKKITIELEGDEASVLWEAINILENLANEDVEDSDWLDSIRQGLLEIVQQNEWVVSDEEDDE